MSETWLGTSAFTGGRKLQFSTIITLYISQRSSVANFNIQTNGLSRHMLVSVCLLGSNLNVNAKPGNLGPSTDTTGI